MRRISGSSGRGDRRDVVTGRDGVTPGDELGGSQLRVTVSYRRCRGQGLGRAGGAESPKTGSKRCRGTT